ncbi:MAG: hypothetical protein ACLFPS_03045 [Clostridia bacterium]
MKNLSKILVLVLVLSLFTNVALAEVEVNDSHVELVERLVEQTNSSIQQDILRTQENADRIVDLFGEYGESYIGDRIIEAMAEALVKLTDAKANAVIHVAEQLGVEVYCEHVPVSIGGYEVMVDPLYVIAD